MVSGGIGFGFALKDPTGGNAGKYVDPFNSMFMFALLFKSVDL